MRRIVFLHPVVFEQSPGGTELQIYYLAKFFAELGWKVYHISIDQGVDILNIEGEITWLKKSNIGKAFGSRWFFYGNRITKGLKRIEPDIIYTRGFYSWAGFASKYSLGTKSSHLMSVASDSDVKKRKNISFLIRPFDIIEYLYVNYAFRYSSKIFVQNEYQRVSIKELYGRNSTILPQLYGDELKEPDYSAKENLTVVWVANMKSIKQPELFIELARRFAIEDKINFIMIGRQDKKLSSAIEKAQKELTQFNYLGELPNTEVNHFLAKADILVNTSKYEGFSNTFIQAWLNATIVLSMNSNPDEIITKNEIGFMCPNISDLEVKIRLLLEDPLKLTKMKKAAYNYALTRYTTKCNSENLKEIFNVG
jgi:glycosyltransferase involved in cell wall biosynthesis